MNEDDIQLITSLIGGELSEAEQKDVLVRIEAEPELRAAYDEQLAVASLLQAAPRAAMTAAESDALRATLAAQLQLADTTAAVAAAGTSRWVRWWAPLTGLAAAALVVVALVVIPDIGEDASLQDAGVAFETTAPTAASEPVPVTGEEEPVATDGGSAFAPSTTAAATESFDTASQYSVSLGVPEEGQLELRVVEPETLDKAGLDPALARSTQLDSIEAALLVDCFSSDTAGVALEPVGVSPDGKAVYATAINPETGEEIVVSINLETCEVSAG